MTTAQLPIIYGILLQWALLSLAATYFAIETDHKVVKNLPFIYQATYYYGVVYPAFLVIAGPFVFVWSFLS